MFKKRKQQVRLGVERLDSRESPAILAGQFLITSNLPTVLPPPGAVQLPVELGGSQQIYGMPGAGGSTTDVSIAW